MGVGCRFKIYIKSHSGLQQVVDSPQCGGGGVLYLLMAFRPFHTEEESLEVKCSSSFLGYVLFWSFYKCNIKVKMWR